MPVLPSTSATVVRPVERRDRDQLTDLVNAHVAAVIPNMSISVSTLMSRLEHEPGEAIEDPWIVERQTLVAMQRGRLVAAAHLVRFSASDQAPEGIRGHAGIRWFVSWPPASYWPDSAEAAERLMTACVAVLRAWRPVQAFADGSLPALGVFGLSDAWPHLTELVTRAGFVHDGQTEKVLACAVDSLAVLPRPAFGIVRTLGVNGTRFSPAHLPAAYLEVDTTLETMSRTGRLGEWADVGNFALPDTPAKAEIATGLLATAGRWLQLGGVRCLLDYAMVRSGDDPDPGYDHVGEPWYPFDELSTTRRGWTLAD